MTDGARRFDEWEGCMAMILVPLVGPDSVDVRCVPENAHDRAVLRILTEICGLKEEASEKGKVAVIGLPTKFADAAPAAQANGARRVVVDTAEPKPMRVRET